MKGHDKMTRDQIIQELNISEDSTKAEIREKLLLVAILNQGIDSAAIILKKYKELADIMGI